MTEWTPDMVEERLVQAAAVLKRLPPVRVGGYFNTWPRMMVEFLGPGGTNAGADALAATVGGRDQQDGGKPGLVVLVGARRREAGLEACRASAVESHLL